MKHELIHYLKLYRHDVMNHLQLVHGYSQLGNAEKLDLKLAEVLDIFQEEQKLFKLNMDQFVMYVLFFNHNYLTMQLSYKINIEKTNLTYMDELVYTEVKKIMELFKDDTSTFVYNWFLEVKYSDNREGIDFVFRLNKVGMDELVRKCDIVAEQFSIPLTIRETDTEIEYSFAVCDEIEVKVNVY